MELGLVDNLVFVYGTRNYSTIKPALEKHSNNPNLKESLKNTCGAQRLITKIQEFSKKVIFPGPSPKFPLGKKKEKKK